VSAQVEMLPRMSMRRRIAATYMTAGQTDPQMHPPRTDSQTILTAVGTRGDVADHVQMRVTHRGIFPFCSRQFSAHRGAF
jgi:hypothetical protein